MIIELHAAILSSTVPQGLKPIIFHLFDRTAPELLHGGEGQLERCQEAALAQHCQVGLRRVVQVEKVHLRKALLSME